MSEAESLIESLHARGRVNANALVGVLRELDAGKPLALDHLTWIFGVADIYELMVRPRQEVDRGRLRRELNDILELLGGSEESAHSPDLVRAVLLLVSLLTEELCGHSILRWPMAARKAMPPAEPAPDPRD
jgi:hypothetical protein